jgi:pimeloyl-ACP methyl ester carboxylesterase
MVEVIHVFHGFLGSPEDFSFLKRNDVIIHDLYEMKDYPSIGPDDTLIGYSLGGRIALEIAHTNNYQLKKVVLINAHPGLAEEEEKMHRAEFETNIVNDLKAKSVSDFMEFWNSLPIFFHDRPIQITENRFAKSAELFDRYRLSKQKNFLPEIIENKSKILYIVGLFDEKYMDLVSETLIPEEVPVKGIAGGHRVFQHAEALKQILVDEGIL